MVKKQDVVKSFFESSKELPGKFGKKINDIDRKRNEIIVKVLDTEKFLQNEVLNTMYGNELYRTEVEASTNRWSSSTSKKEIYTFNRQGLGTIFEWKAGEERPYGSGVARSEPIKDILVELNKETIMEQIEAFLIKKKSRKVGTWQEIMKLRNQLKILSEKKAMYANPVRHTQKVNFLYTEIENGEYKIKEISGYQYVITNSDSITIITAESFINKELNTYRYSQSSEEKNSKIEINPERTQDLPVFMQIEDELDTAIDEMDKKLTEELAIVNDKIEEIKSGLAVYTVIASIKKGGN
jgi:anti-sigma28 factor (negative regulator of flagellin synthesis)